MGIFDSLASSLGYEKRTEKPRRKRGFEAAQINRLTSSWQTVPKPIDADIRRGLGVARARCRDAALNNDYVKHYLRLLKSNVVGPVGIQTVPQSQNDNGTLDIIANQAIKEAFGQWCMLGTPDVTGKFSWPMIQSLFIETVAKDGECFIRRHRNWRGNDFRYALEFIDAEAVDRTLSHELGNGRAINMGIELDAWRRPVAYYVVTTSATSDVYEYYGRKYKRIPADEMIHGYLPDSILQTRGYPWLAVSLMRLQMLHGYEEAELVAARTASAKMGFFYEDPEAGGGEFSGDEDHEGAILTDAEPGTFERLPPGLKFEAWDPSHPSTAYEQFVKANLRGTAAGLGVSYYTLANDLTGVNYNSGRLGSIEDRELWKGLQRFLIEVLVDKVVREDWLPNALLAGQITIAGNPLKSTRIKKYSRIRYQGKRWPWVDPKKDMEGHLLALDRKLQSPQQVMVERGDDPDEVLDQWAEWEKKLAARNLTVTPTTVITGAPDAEDDTE